MRKQKRNPWAFDNTSRMKYKGQWEMGNTSS